MSTIPGLPSMTGTPSDALDQRFRELTELWEAETGHQSSMDKASLHPAYQEIIQMGPPVVPLLLRDLEMNHRHWFIALRKITGAQPIPISVAGNIPQMVESWLRWAKDNGYRW
jgi:hypothetical protein